MSRIVREETAATFEDVYRGGYDKKYPSLDLVRLESWYFGRKPGLALDYGCGPGTNGIHLIDCGYRVVFADVAREALIRVQEKIDARPDAKDRARVRAVDVKADRLPEADGTFDYVVCLSMLGNLDSADGVVALLSEFRRVLKPGGKMICDINGVDSVYVHESSGKVAEGVYSVQPRAGHKTDDILMYFPDSAETFAGLVRKAGFVVDDVGYSGFNFMGHGSYEYVVCAHRE